MMSSLSSVLSTALSRLSLTSTPPVPSATATVPSTAAPPPPSSTSSAPALLPNTSFPAPVPTPIPDGFVLACPLSTLPLGSRRCVSVSSRALLIFRLASSASSSASSRPPNAVPTDSSAVWAIDAICYHMGGQLIEGDIECLLGTYHVVCPWHHFRISIESGEGAYQVAKDQWKSKGKRQRTHEVRIIDDAVYVRVGSSADGKLESDVYGDRLITPEDVEAQEQKRQAGGGYVSKGPSGLHRGIQY